MKYTLDESMQQFKIRSEELHRKIEKRTAKVLYSSITVLAVLLVVILHGTVTFTVPEGSGYQYGSSLLSQEAGGYILVAVIAFVLGLATAIAILHRSGRLKHPRHISDHQKAVDMFEERK